MQVRTEPLFPGHPTGPLLLSDWQGVHHLELDQWFADNRLWLLDLLRDRGALLLRGSGLNSAQLFGRCMHSLDLAPFGYLGGDSPRKAVAENVFTSTEYPASARISLHHEMSYLPEWPTIIGFYADRAPVANGQTSLALSKAVTAAIPPDLAHEFRARGLRYIRNFPAQVPVGRSWQDTYSTDDPDEVSAIAARQNSRAIWSDQGQLRIETDRPAYLDLDNGDGSIWFNQAEQWHPSALPPQLRSQLARMLGAQGLPHDCCFGDGAPIPDEVMHCLRAAIAGTKLLFDWCDGDLLLIDNRLMMHGREAFAGERRILAYLAA